MMNATQIASAHILDIVFDGRNKAYGAYQLHRHYNTRLTAALSSVIGLALALFFISGHKQTRVVENGYIPAIDTLVLVKPVELIKPEAVDQPEDRPNTVRNTPPLIVSNDTPIDTVPTIDVLQSAVSGTETNPGVPVEGNPYTAPPAEVAKAPAAAPVQTNVIHDYADVPATFPGGIDAWRRYLEKYLNYPEQAIETGKEGTVKLQFIVDTEGTISEVKALNNPGDGLAEEAIRIIKRGPKWKPAEQGGSKVIYRAYQTVTFKFQ